MEWRCDAPSIDGRVRGGGVVIREATCYQVLCDHCGRAGESMWNDRIYAVHTWVNSERIAVGGRHACDSAECGRKVLDAHPDLVARSSSESDVRWWVAYDGRRDEYAAFFEYLHGPVPILQGGTLADAMREVWAW